VGRGADEVLKPLPNASFEATQAFREECRAKADLAQKSFSIGVKGRDGWLFFGPELRHVGVGRFWGDRALDVSRASNLDHADPLPAILDFKAQLDTAGVELLFVPVPPKSIVYADKLTSRIQMMPQGLPRFDIAHQEFYDELRQQGVNVLDLAPKFWAHRGDADPTYCRTDTHWSGRACVFVARRIKELYQEKEWLKQVPRREFSSVWKRIAINGDLRTTSDKSPREQVLLRFVGTPSDKAKATASLQPLEVNRDSPILLLGDSHGLVFHDGEDMHTRGAGLADQLALEFGFAIDLIAVRGSGATPARINLMRRVKANPTYLRGKKLVIWCFSAREFTESLGWQKVPLTK
jgi:alginate O-acetyltransferase complex protein AlgJ